jgi:molecular chaperone GrpE
MSEPVETTQQPAGQDPAGAAGPGETTFGDAEAPPSVPVEETAAQAPAPADAPEAAPEPGAADAASAPEASEGGDVAQDLDELLARTRERDQYLQLAQRTQADFENYRRRMARESAQALDRGVAKLAKELLPALDHLELAVKAAEGHEDVVKGFAIVRDEFVNALGKAGIEPFSPDGQPFDPTEHEAMASQPADGAASGTVITVYQQGYRHKGAVLRPARVVVAA